MLADYICRRVDKYRVVFLSATRSGSGSQARCADDVHCIRHAALKDNARFVQIADEFAVKAFIAQLVMKALNMPVFPGNPGFDVKRFYLLGFQPVLHVGGDKLRPIYATQ